MEGLGSPRRLRPAHAYPSVLCGSPDYLCVHCLPCLSHAFISPLEFRAHSPSCPPESPDCPHLPLANTDAGSCSWALPVSALADSAPRLVACSASDQDTFSSLLPLSLLQVTELWAAGCISGLPPVCSISQLPIFILLFAGSILVALYYVLI